MMQVRCKKHDGEPIYDGICFLCVEEVFSKKGVSMNESNIGFNKSPQAPNHDFCVRVLVRELCEGEYAMIDKVMIARGILRLRSDKDSCIAEMNHLGGNAQAIPGGLQQWQK